MVGRLGQRLEARGYHTKSLRVDSNVAEFKYGLSAVGGDPGVWHMAMRLLSSAFGDGEEIPVRFTCEGDDVSPPLSWEGIPEGTMSLALIVDDPDAPDPAAPKMTWVHWVVFNLPPETREISEGATALPKGTRFGFNDFKRTSYGGPCPPIGRHRYFCKLFALDCKIPDLDTPTKDELLTAMAGHVLAEAQLMGTYIKLKNR